MFVLAVMGSGVMYLLFGWLLSAIIASLFSGEKGYGERPGLATGLIVPGVAILIWLVWPARAESDWRVAGPTNGARIAMFGSVLLGIGSVIGSFVADVDTGALIAMLVFGIAIVVAALVAIVTSRSPASPQAA